MSPKRDTSEEHKSSITAFTGVATAPVLATGALAQVNLTAEAAAPDSVGGNSGGYDAIEGATLYNGPPCGGTLHRARSMVKLATRLDEGKGYTGVQVNWGQAVKPIADGSADAFMLPMNLPDGRQAPQRQQMDVRAFVPQGHL